jgi:membrane fusion protein, multidrug efflux system
MNARTRLHFQWAVLFTSGLAAACGGKAESAVEKPRGVPVRTVPVEIRDIDDTLVLSGSLRPRAQVQVVAEVGARLLRVVKDEGARAQAGEALALLDDTDSRLAHDRAKAALALAEANRAHAQAEKERADNLRKTGGITEKDQLAAEVGQQVADASLGQARADAAIAAEQLARCTVKAPFTGRVAKRLTDPGAMLTRGTPIFTFVDDAVLEFRASVPSTDYSRAKVGAPADITVDSLPDQRIQGKVSRVTPLIAERTRSFEVVIEVPGGPGLVGGLFGRAEVRAGHVPAALVVPPSALTRDGENPDQAQLFVVSSGKAERRTVSLGVEGAHAVQVTKGLAAGDQVVLDPPAALSSGAPVEVQNGGRN